MKKSVSEKVKSMTQTTESKFPVLGYAIWWSLREQEIPKTDLEALLKTTLGEEHIPREPRKKRALRLAIKTMVDAQLIFKIRDDAEVVVYGLGSELIDAEKNDFGLAKKQVVILDKGTGNLRFTRAFRSKHIQELFEKYQEVFTSSDLRKVILDYARRHNRVTLRQTGGIYFLRDEAPVLALKAFFAGIKNAEFFSLGIVDDSAGRGQVLSVVRKEMEDDLKKLAADVDMYAAKSDTRDSTWAFRLEEFSLLKVKTEAYADILQTDASALLRNLHLIKTKVESALVGEVKQNATCDEFPIGSRCEFIGVDEDFRGEQGKVMGYDLQKRKTYIKVFFDDGTIYVIHPSELRNLTPLLKAELREGVKDLQKRAGLTPKPKGKRVKKSPPKPKGNSVEKGKSKVERDNEMLDEIRKQAAKKKTTEKPPARKTAAQKARSRK